MGAPRYEWQPTTEEIARRTGIAPHRIVRFDHNTSPFTTDWAPGLITTAARGLNEYPAASYQRIRESAAKYLGCEPEQVVPGAGIDDLILLTAQAFLDPGGSAVSATPTYPLYRIATLRRDARFVEVPLLPPRFDYDADALVAAAATADVVWLCVPNNPTGNRLAGEAIAAVIAATEGVVFLDAAYAEISGDDWTPWVARFPNLIVAQTLSKGFGLAGARVGYAAANPDLSDVLDAVRPPGGISTLSVELAVNVLDEPGRMRRKVSRLLRERTRFASVIAELGLEVLPSEGNFVLVRVGPAARRLAADLLQEGLIVRDFAADGSLAEHLRFTVRSPEEDDRLVDALWRRLS